MTGAVDWSVLERLADDLDDDELVDILVTAYRGELPARRDALRSSLAASTAEMADAAHALKAASESIGALALGRTCREARAAARAGGARRDPREPGIDLGGGGRLAEGRVARRLGLGEGRGG